MKEIILSNSDLVCVVDDIDYMRFALFKCKLSPSGYAALGSPMEFVHSIIAARIGIVGKIDHKDRNRMHCWRDNLRAATKSQNGANVEKRTGYTSKYKGVRRHSQNECWTAQIMVNFRAIYLGSFKIEEDAAMAYNKAALHYFKEFACLNEVK